MIITSLLDTDLYKLTMQQIVYHRFSDLDVNYKFVARREGYLFNYINEIAKEISEFLKLRFNEQEVEYLRSLGLFSDDYLKALNRFFFDMEVRVNPSDIKYNTIDLNIVKRPEDICQKLEITIYGSWFQTILLEVPILAIINEIYYRQSNHVDSSWIKNGTYFLEQTIDKIEQYSRNNSNTIPTIIDMGTRRRVSKAWHHYVYNIFFNKFRYNTSNVYLAKTYGSKPIGTMAHEYLQVGQALVDLKDSQKYMLDNWYDEYGNTLNCALTDVIGVDAFLKDWNIEQYTKVRHDSGCPFKFVDKIVSHLKKSKRDEEILLDYTIVFSDNLTIDRVFELMNYCKDKIKCVFGMGTFLTNNIGLTPLQNVIKIVSCNGKPVVKISDTPEKAIGDKDMIEKVMKTFKVKK